MPLDCHGAAGLLCGPKPPGAYVSIGCVRVRLPHVRPASPQVTPLTRSCMQILLFCVVAPFVLRRRHRHRSARHFRCSLGSASPNSSVRWNARGTAGSAPRLTRRAAAPAAPIFDYGFGANADAAVPAQRVRAAMPAARAPPDSIPQSLRAIFNGTHASLNEEDNGEL